MNYRMMLQSTQLLKKNLEFWNKPQEILNDIGTCREVIVMKYLDIEGILVALYGEDYINDNEEKLIDLCNNSEMKIMKVYFKHKTIHKFTFK